MSGFRVVPMLVAAAVAAPVTQARVRAGTASISGTVVTMDAAAVPVRRAVVSLTEQTVAGAPVVVTDDQGRFSFTSLPAGRYLVQATKAAHLPAAFGVTRPMRQGTVPTGTAIALADGQQATGVLVQMARGSVIAGVVHGPDGQPMRNAAVRISCVRRTPSGDRTTVLAATATTDGRGLYRAFGLAPGDYIVSATPSVGPTTDIEQLTSMQISQALKVTIPVGPPVAPPPRETWGDVARVGYAPVFFPGVFAPGEAATISLGAGEERAGVDFRIRFVPNARIEGVVLGPDGRGAAGARVTMTARDPARVAGIGLPAGLTDASGKFSLRGIAPGDYLILAVMSTPSAIAASAVAPVDVVGGGVVNATLTLTPPVSMAGRVVLAAGAGPPPDLTQLRLAFLPAPALPSMNPPVSADGRFSATLAAATYRVAAGPPLPPGWVIQSATIAGQDALDASVELAPGRDVESVVTLTNRMAELGGTMLDAAGRPAPEYFVIVFPADRTRWGWGSDRIHQTRPASDGTFVFHGLPAGDYLIGAVTDVEVNQWFEPEFLASLAGGSIKVSVADGERKTQDLRVR